MYNETLKEDFIAHYLKDLEDSDTYERNKRVLINHFNTTEPYEEEKGKDLCDFEKDDVLECYRSLRTRSIIRLRAINSYFKNYFEYCIEKGVTKEKKDTIGLEDLKDCVIEDEIAISREDLIREISILPNVSDRFFCLAVFEGICGKAYADFFDLKGSDFRDGKVYLPDRTLEVTDELAELARESAEEFNYYAYNESSGFSVKGMHYYYADKELCIKSLYNAIPTDKAVVKSQRMRNKLDRIRKYLELNVLQMKSLVNSGKIDMIRRYREEHPDLSIKRAMLDLNEEIKYRYGKIRSTKEFEIHYKKYLEG